MRPVDRSLCACPSDWTEHVTRRFSDFSAFQTEASKFEKLAINSAERRKGFFAFAPHVLRKKKGRPEFPAAWGKHKELIAQMSHRKCAYCEVPINAPRAADVEHFHPKALFPRQAYEWDNYFLGCSGCNGAKSSKWPKRGGYVRPDRGDPSGHFVFAEDGTVEPVQKNGPAERTLEDFNLRRKWLTEQRKDIIELMLSHLSDAVTSYNSGSPDIARRLARTTLADVTNPRRAYSAALTQCFLRSLKSACPGLRL